MHHKVSKDNNIKATKELKTKAKLDDQFSKFLNIFKKIEINIPFAEALD